MNFSRQPWNNAKGTIPVTNLKRATLHFIRISQRNFFGRVPFPAEIFLQTRSEIIVIFTLSHPIRFIMTDSGKVTIRCIFFFYWRVPFSLPSTVFKLVYFLILLRISLYGDEILQFPGKDPEKWTFWKTLAWGALFRVKIILLSNCARKSVRGYGGVCVPKKNC